MAPSESPRPSIAETACFEAGIKFGSLYHQFAGTPISEASAASLATAIEESIENQPHCTTVSVDVDEDAVGEAAGDTSYTEFTGRLFEAEVVVEYEGVEVVASMAMEDGYPLMQIDSVRSTD